MLYYEKRVRASKKELRETDISPILKDLKGKLAEKILHEVEALSKTQSTEKHLKCNNLYGEELRKQISEKKEKKKKEKITMADSGISKDFNGYPNIVKTSLEELQAIKQRQKEAMKWYLESQILNKKVKKDWEKSQEFELDLKFNGIALDSLEKELVSKGEKRAKQVQILNKTWAQAVELKKLKDFEEQIARKGCNLNILKSMTEKPLNDTETTVADYIENLSRFKIPNKPLQVKIRDISPHISRRSIAKSIISEISYNQSAAELPKISKMHHKSCTNLIFPKPAKRFPPYPKPLPSGVLPLKSSQTWSKN